MSYNWTCPFCDRRAVLTKASYAQHEGYFAIPNKHGPRFVQLHFAVCPNPDCQKFVLNAAMFDVSTALGATSRGRIETCKM